MKISVFAIWIEAIIYLCNLHDCTGQVENSETSEISEISEIFFRDF